MPMQDKGNPPQYIVDESGRRVSVVLSVEAYEALLEDVSDLAAMAERREEDVAEHAEVVQRLKADGLL